MHELSQVLVDADPAAWAAAGFAVPSAGPGCTGTCTIGQTTIVFGDAVAAAGDGIPGGNGDDDGTNDIGDSGAGPASGIVALAIAGLDPGDLDGMTLVAAPPT
ncbi:MAG: hypothetical protein R6W93_07655, partial [Candidatus Limnocylindrales bacterium]